MNMDKRINTAIQELEEELICSPEKQQTKKLFNKIFTMSFQIQEPSSFNNLDQVRDDASSDDSNNGDTAASNNDDDNDNFFVMRGKSSTISKCCDVELRPAVAVGSLAEKRKAFLLQQRKSIQIPSARKIENASTKEEISFTTKYCLGQKLGEGANAIVKMCYEKDEGEIMGNRNKPFAVKIFKTESIEDTLEIQRESQILQQMSHPTIIKFKDLVIEKSKNKAYLVQEFARGKVLSNYLIENCPQRIMNELTAVSIIKQLLQGINCLHVKNICHFDLKPDNIIFNEIDGKVKIIDFSSSRKSCPNQKLLTNIGTLNYKSPEYFGMSQRNTKSDIWSIGVILYQLLIGQVPFDDTSNNSRRVAENIKSKNFQQDYKNRISPKMLELLDCMLVIDPQQRLSASQLLQKLPSSIELLSLKNLKSKPQHVKQIKNSAMRCSIQNFDLSLNKLSTKQTFNDLLNSPELPGCKTDRVLKIDSMQLDQYKHLASTHFDHLLI